MFPILQVGPLAIQTPGLILLLGVWLGLTLAERHAFENKVNPDRLYNLAFAGLVSGVAGARLIYAARFSSAFLDNPASLISLNPGLLDPAGGLATGLIAALIYGQRAHLPFWRTLDVLTPAFAVTGVAIGLAQLAAGTAFGAQTDLPWAIALWGAARHPTQIYNVLAAGLILFITWPGGTRLSQYARTPGSSFLIFLALSSGARLFLEAFRGDSALLANGVRAAQVIAWLVLAVSLWSLTRLNPAGAQSREDSQKQKEK